MTQKIQEIEENLHELEKKLSRMKKFYDHDDIEYKGIRHVFRQPIDEDYYNQ